MEYPLLVGHAESDVVDTSRYASTWAGTPYSAEAGVEPQPSGRDAGHRPASLYQGSSDDVYNPYGIEHTGAPGTFTTFADIVASSDKVLLGPEYHGSALVPAGTAGSYSTGGIAKAPTALIIGAVALLGILGAVAYARS